MGLPKHPDWNKVASDKSDTCFYYDNSKEYSSTNQVFNKLINNSSSFNYKVLKNVLISFNKDWRDFFSFRYIPKLDAQNFLKPYKRYVQFLNNPSVLKYIQDNSKSIGLDFEEIKRFINNIKEIEDYIDDHNEKYINTILEHDKDYFDDMLIKIDPNIKLDEEQRRAIIADENYCLLIAGAGAGKTTTMAAKVKYLVEKQCVPQSDIIVISYTNKAIDELKDRIQNKLGLKDVNICTFHSFGYDILRKTNKIPPIVNRWAYNIIFDYLEKQILSDNNLLRKIVLFLGYYFDIPDEAFNFESLNAYCEYRAMQDFESLKSRLGDYNQIIINRKSKRQITILGEYLRSQQEVQIANFLYINGIDYIYEKPYPHLISESKKIYTPDFYIKQGENECWIEHFGISQDFQNPLFTYGELQKYKHSIISKRQLHQKYKTPLLETYAKYNDNRDLLEHLEEELIKRGFVLNRRSDEEIYKKLTESSKDKYVNKFIEFLIIFIDKYKTCGYDEDGFKVLREKQNNVRINMFLEIAEQVYKYYNYALKANNQIDFADMINDAAKILWQMEESKVNLTYKYIIIDEFQDIAQQRFNLTKALANITKAKVVAVGDDWQSIFAFAGADITLFKKFIELMGSGIELQIKHTYRNSQELIDMAGGFIQKNHSQIKKRLISPKSLPNPIKVFGYDDSKGKSLRNWGVAIERAVDEIVKEYGEKTSILMIGRYNFEKYNLLTYGPFEAVTEEEIKSKKHPNTSIFFLTAHRAKGLGFDNVIVVNMRDDKFGFPSQIEDDPIMKLVRVTDHSYPFAEERRLFYVALTRTKNRTYLITPNSRPSRFVLELINDYNIPHDETIAKTILDINTLKCPKCGAKLKFENNKNYGLPLYMCTNDPEICDFMTNSKKVLADIFKCNKCADGYMIVSHSKKNNDYFYSCTNYYNDKKCKNMLPIPHDLKGNI
jgi:DNA helicase-4